jgi:hypothetical protein
VWASHSWPTVQFLVAGCKEGREGSQEAQARRAP